jgi:hypothetical protein
LEIMRANLFYSVLVSLLFLGCQSKYYAEADFKSVTKIDAHAHLNSENTYFEEQALKDNFKLITINVDHSDSAAVKKQLEYSLKALQKFPGEVFYSATFYFDTTGWEDKDWSNKVIDQLRENTAGGAVSVKLWKNIGMTVKDRKGNFIMVDNPKMDPVIDFIISKNLPVTGHLGEPRNCWMPLSEMTVRNDSGYFAHNPQYHMFLHPEYPSYEDQINARDNLLEKHPDLKFIGCHLGSLEWNVDELAKRLDKFPNMAVDLAARICHLQYQSKTNRDKIRDFCIKYQDRIIYGTDLSDDGRGNAKKMAENYHNTWIDDWRYFATDEKMTSDTFTGSFLGLQLPKEVVRKIFGENAVKWYNLDLKKK